MPELDLIAAVRVAEEWAQLAGDIALRDMGHATVRRKADGTEVTDADVAIQRMIGDEVHRRFPDHAFIAEETLQGAGAHPAPADATHAWVVDPLDGTRNYVRGYPAFATSIALMDRGRPVLGVVRWHHTEQVFTAVAAGGARLNGESIRAPARPMDPGTLIGAQLGPQHHTQEIVAPWLDRWAVRNLGATALHLALTATGSLGAAFAKDCWIWDLAAGALLVEEAGGRFTGLRGEAIFPVNPATCAVTNYPFVAGNATAHQVILADLQSRGQA